MGLIHVRMSAIRVVKGALRKGHDHAELDDEDFSARSTCHDLRNHGAFANVHVVHGAVACEGHNDDVGFCVMDVVHRIMSGQDLQVADAFLSLGDCLACLLCNHLFEFRKLYQMVVNSLSFHHLFKLKVVAPL